MLGNGEDSVNPLFRGCEEIGWFGVSSRIEMGAVQEGLVLVLMASAEEARAGGGCRCWL